MATISLVRIDFRLIHGQVVTKWVKEANVERIVIVNDVLACDEFLGSVYKMAAPSNIEVSIFTINDAIREWKEHELGEGRILLLFKNVTDCRKLQELGFPMDFVQIGGLGGGAGRVNTSTGISFDASDAQQLKEMCSEGKNVYIHVIPTQQKYDVEKILSHISFDE